MYFCSENDLIIKNQYLGVDDNFVIDSAIQDLIFEISTFESLIERLDVTQISFYTLKKFFPLKYNHELLWNYASDEKYT